jgi:Pentapeptide repeats (8 copies)
MKLKRDESGRVCMPGADMRDADMRGADMFGADLRGADMFGADMRGADMFGADMRDVDMSDADMRDARMRGADMRDVDLRGADMRGVDLRDTRLFGANFCGADLRGALLPTAPAIPDIHRRVYEAATSTPESLDMIAWHTCETTHCRAGWVVVLAGLAGKELEERVDTGVAAALIYMASDPTLECIPDWRASNEDALADMRRLAGVAV